MLPCICAEINRHHGSFSQRRLKPAQPRPCGAPAAMFRGQNAQFKDIAPFLLGWITPGMRHTKYEAMMIYETWSYILATFSLPQRQHYQLMRFRNITTSCRSFRFSEPWHDLNFEIGKVHRLAWQRFPRVNATLRISQDVSDCKRPARRRILRDHLWTRDEENRFDIFWRHTMTLRRRWRPDFVLNPYGQEMHQTTKPGTRHSPFENP